MSRVPSLRRITVTRYVTPLREGGSLPAIVEADDDGMYVLKFRAAGHGALALIAEVIAGEIARAIGLPVPEIVIASLDTELARTEPDPEIHALIHDSAGLNAALDYLPGAVNFDPVVHTIDPGLASRIVWFDALVANVDRTPRNTNMLMWHGRPWLIDHGSTLYFHHSPGWQSEPQRARAPFPALREHVLLRQATSIADEDPVLAGMLTSDVLAGILALLPDEWFPDEEPAAARAADQRYRAGRRAAPRTFLEEAARGR